MAKKGKQKAKQRKSEAPPASVATVSTPAPASGPELLETVELTPAPSVDAEPVAAEHRVAGSLVESGEHPLLAESFFDQHVHAEHEAHDTFDDLVPETLEHAAHQHRARRATFVVSALGLLLVGGYFLYTRFGTVQPVELGGGGVTLPPIVSHGPAIAPATDATATAAHARPGVTRSAH